MYTKTEDIINFKYTFEDQNLCDGRTMFDRLMCIRNKKSFESGQFVTFWTNKGWNTPIRFNSGKFGEEIENILKYNITQVSICGKYKGNVVICNARKGFLDVLTIKGIEATTEIVLELIKGEVK